MGRILQFFDFNQAITSRKLLGHKRQNDGLEAPRNSLEFPVETSQIYHAIPEEIPYSCQLKHQSAKLSFPSNHTPIKKLLDEEMTWKTNNRCSRPSVVARLMGIETSMDALQLEAKPLISATEGKVEKLIPRKEPAGVISTYHTSLISTPSKQTKKELLPYGIEHDFDRPTKSHSPTKPQPREHPQEELLQKFKKEFEAWQASKVWERSSSLVLEKDLIHDKDMQILAQENLNKEKMSRCMDGKLRKKSIERKDHLFTARQKNDAEQWGGSRHDRFVDRRSQYILDNETTLRTAETSFAQLPVAKFNNEKDRPSSPIRIVLLKPSSERRIDFEDSAIGSPEILQKENSMEDFLEEVKNKLKLEIYGKAKKDPIAKQVETGTSLCKRSADPKQIAKHIAKQVRESVARDFRATLMRSESMRSYRSEAYSDGQNSPEFIHRDTRKFLAERLKNVLRNEREVEIPSVASGKPSASFSKKEEMRQVYDFSKCKKISFWEDDKALTESKTRSFRHEHENDMACEIEEVSPRNLIRSFSAPVSGTAFGKLLLEDQHILTGAHIRRKQEASDNASAKVNKSKKDGFNLKGRVSNLRQNFTLKGKLFGKKVQWLNQPATNEFPSMRMIVTAPTVVINSGNAQDNSTEVPPSPASASSSPTDEICHPSHPSPVSPLEALFIEDHSSSQVFGELSSSHPGLCQLSKQVLNVGFDEVIMEGESYQDEFFEVEGHAKAYVKDILVAAGLYTSQPFDVAISRWDSLTKPISKRVFEGVEDAYSRNEKAEGVSILCDSDKDLTHKMLFDLINEALPSVLATPRIRSTKKWGLGPSSVSNGKKLLNNLWQQIQSYANSPMGGCHSLDSLVEWDMKMSPFSNMQHEDIDVIGGEIELLVLEELIDEFVRDLCF